MANGIVTKANGQRRSHNGELPAIAGARTTVNGPLSQALSQRQMARYRGRVCRERSHLQHRNVMEYPFSLAGHERGNSVCLTCSQ